MSGKELILVRHAKSSWDNMELYDHDRPLNERGKRNAPEMGERLKRHGTNPDAVFTSTALRAATTAKIISKKLDFRSEQIFYETGLYHADVSKWLEFICGLDDQWGSVMAFGHNPGLTELVADVWGLPVVNVPTCGVIFLTFEGGAWIKTVLEGPATARFDYPKNKSAAPEDLV